MPTDQNSWGINSLTKLLRFFTKEEVKTPLSFLYKIVPYLIGSLIIILYAPISNDMKMQLVQWTFLALLGLSVAVLLFGWFRPKNLVYGESGHKAEFKIEYGTEQKTIGQGDLEELEPTESKNPILLK